MGLSQRQYTQQKQEEAHWSMIKELSTLPTDEICRHIRPRELRKELQTSERLLCQLASGAPQEKTEHLMSFIARTDARNRQECQKQAERRRRARANQATIQEQLTASTLARRPPIPKRRRIIMGPGVPPLEQPEFGVNRSCTQGFLARKNTRGWRI